MQMRSRSLMVGTALIAAALASSTSVQAQAITTGQWNAMTTPDNNGTPFWDDLSNDGTNCNVGFYLLYTRTTGYGPCSSSKPNAAFVNNNAGRLGTTGGVPNGSYLTNAAMTGPSGYSFAAGSYNLEVLANIAGFGPPGQELWAFSAGPGGPVALQQLYGSAVPASGSPFMATFNTDWFLGARSARGANPWLYSDGASSIHWALFSENAAGNTTAGNRYWATFGDVPSGGDSDYNDIVLQIQSATIVPEPSTWALMAAGLASLAVVGRRRRVKPESNA